MIHRGSGVPNVQLGFGSQTTNWFHTTSLSYVGYTAGFTDGFSFIDPIDNEEYTTARSAMTFVELDHRSERQVLMNDTAMRLWLGGGFVGQLGSIDHGYAHPTFGYTIFFGLAPSARLERDISDRTMLYATLSVPVVSWLARSPYLLNDDEFIENQSSHRTFRTLNAFVGDGHLASFGTFRRVQFQIGALHRISPKWQVGLNYSLEYLDISTPLRLISYRNGLDLAIHFNLRKA